MRNTKFTVRYKFYLRSFQNVSFCTKELSNETNFEISRRTLSREDMQTIAVFCKSFTTKMVLERAKTERELELLLLLVHLLFNKI